MKDILKWLKSGAVVIIGVVVTVSALLAGIYTLRLFMNSTAPITVHEVEEGIHCAISSGGEAIDCWKV